MKCERCKQEKKSVASMRFEPYRFNKDTLRWENVAKTPSAVESVDLCLECYRSSQKVFGMNPMRAFAKLYPFPSEELKEVAPEPEACEAK